MIDYELYSSVVEGVPEEELNKIVEQYRRAFAPGYVPSEEEKELWAELDFDEE